MKVFVVGREMTGANQIETFAESEAGFAAASRLASDLRRAGHAARIFIASGLEDLASSSEWARQALLSSQCSADYQPRVA